MRARIVGLGLAIFLGGVGPADAAVLTKGQNLRVMPLGDSITLGKDMCLGGYRRPLYEWLLKNGYAITYVGKQNLQIRKDHPNACSDGSIPWHEGYGSFRTDMILNGGTAEGQTSPPLATTLATYKPDVVLLMIGTNDVLQNYQLDTAPARLQAILEAIRTANPKTVVLVASIPPIVMPPNADPKWAQREKDVETYNAAIPGVIAHQAALGQPVIFVDVNAMFGHRFNGVHPDSMGYAKIAAVWYKALTGEDAPAIDRTNPLLLPPTAPAPAVTTTSNTP